MANSFEVEGRSGFGSIKRTAHTPQRVLALVELLLYYGSTTISIVRLPEPEVKPISGNPGVY
jgi:hypothetical protein